MTPAELFTKELLSYENQAGSHDAFYYNLPYVKDYDLCNWHPLRMQSGNIIKFYQYKVDKPLILFTDTEDIPPDPMRQRQEDVPYEDDPGDSDDLVSMEESETDDPILQEDASGYDDFSDTEITDASDE